MTYHSVNVSWEVVSQNFQTVKESLDANDSNMFIGVGKELITVNNQNEIGFGYKSRFICTCSNVTMSDRSLTIATDIWANDDVNIFPIWKGFVFVFTGIALSAFTVELIRGRFDPASLLFLFILLVFNSVCWISTFFMKSEVRSIERRILKIADGKW